ncbi:MAG: 3-phosphoshikimate 1-carboxyvinyltransferase [Deltaproteobacteria bacterium]|nr:3-phosphoshikimate 1-carboxyvinyltransferase [Deltaproteobacteria bacterium]
MQKSVASAAVNGRVVAPSSKSLLQRAIMVAALTRGTTTLRVESGSYCDDVRAALAVASALGAEVIEGGRALVIRGGHPPRATTLHCGESGLSLRMTCAVSALFDQAFTITGSGSLTTRPIGDIGQPLALLGVACHTTAGHLPVCVQGPLHGGVLTLDGSLSSQFLTGLLIALPLAKEESMLIVTSLASRPYVAMTCQVLRDCGIRLDYSAAFDRFTIPGGQHYVPRTYTVEGDWSGAAPLLVAGALAGAVEVAGLSSDSLQADAAVLTVLRAVGAAVTVQDDTVAVQRSRLRPFTFDATDAPDLFPPLVALAVFCEGESRIGGVGRLVHKESNRGRVLVEEFGKLGARVRLADDELCIAGGHIVHGGCVASHGDHRIAMALAVAALRADGPVTIVGAESVAKSYPTFFEDLATLQERI